MSRTAQKEHKKAGPAGLFFSPSLPLAGSVLLNGTPPIAFPLGGRWRAAPDEGSLVPRPAVAGYFAPRRERFICLRRPHFFQQRKKWGKERRQKLRFCTSSARYAQQRFPAHSRGQSLLPSLSDKRTVPAFTGAEAPAAACPSHGRRFSLLPPSPKAFPSSGAPPQAFPLDGSRC